MSDTDSLSDLESPEQQDDHAGSKQMEFVRILKDNAVLLNKSQVPGVKKQKTEAMARLIKQYQKKTGLKMCDKQVYKKLNNMKTDVKGKADKTRTGNRPIHLKAWEKEFLDLVDAESNPTISGNVGGYNFLCYS